ncbi:hypothetical protein [Salinibacter ruber]|uniref:Uncharacterized protein n=1 Tax=Salinibacter ruber TaxID=146919 RepID=A0A9X2Q5R5_9BACT|nr:hypothetical protein [Salinibacter ruber]MCS3662001.1 hypothetical protein [Salinibacter ruber]MCS3711796.1 hypothetical protein [Salinibacter ruber]MCS4142639.1 hypothetical protein [Salinibacter ruber]
MNTDELPFDIDFAINLNKFAQEAKEAQGLKVTKVIDNTEDRLTIWVDSDVGEGFKLDFRRRSHSDIDIYTTAPNGPGMMQVYTSKSDEGAWFEYDFILETIDVPLKIFGDEEAQKSKEEIKAEIRQALEENGRFEREGVSKKWKNAATEFVLDGYEVSTTHGDGEYDICVEPPEEEKFGLEDVTGEMLSWMESNLQERDLSADPGEIRIPKRVFAYRDGEKVDEVKLVTGTREELSYSAAFDAVWKEKKGQIPDDADQLGFIVLGCTESKNGGAFRIAQTIATDGEDASILANLYQNGWVFNSSLQLQTEERWSGFAEELAEYIS